MLPASSGCNIMVLRTLVASTSQTACAPLLARQAPASIFRQVATRSLWTASPKHGGLLASLHTGRGASGLLTRLVGRQPFRPITALTDGQVITRPSSDSEKWKRIGFTTAAIVGGAGVLSLFNNRETRDALSSVEAGYLNKTFSYVGIGLGITAVSAIALHRTGFSYRIMRANPWLVIGGSLVASVGSMMMAFSTSPDATGAKHFWWTAFNVAQSATLSPLLFFQPALLARAGLYTAGLVGSLAYVGATARSDKYLYIGGPLFAGLCVVALSGLAPLVLPVGTAALAVTQGISLYGGLAVFGGFVLYDTQKVLERGRAVEAGLVKGDPVAESIRFELDIINIFVRIVQILAMQQRRK